MYIRKIEIESIRDNSLKKIDDEDWLVYGHSDILKTKIIHVSEEKKNKFIKMYEDIYYDDRLKQQFYLFYDFDDIEFWENNKNSKFVGVYFLTLNVNVDDLSDIEESDYNKIRFYRTLDNYDYVIICNGNTPSEINNTISNTFLKKNNIHSVYKLYMTSYKIINYYYLKKKKNLNDHTKIDFSMQIVLNNLRVLNDCVLEIKNYLEKEDMKHCINQTSGSSDLSIFVYEIPVFNFFSLFETIDDIGGIFSINSSLRGSFIKSTRIKFLIKPESKSNNEVYKNNSEKTPDKNESKTNWSSIYEKLKNFIEEARSRNNINSFYQSQLSRIIYSLCNIINNNLPDYSMLILYPALYKFMEKIFSETNYVRKDDCIRYFLEAARDIVNMSDESQIGYYTMHAYLCKEVTVPLKLTCFYSALLWKINDKVLKIQNDKESTFTFCLTPSLKANVCVKGLFLDDNKLRDRLLLAYIPMKNLYDPEIMIFSLCHEASHYIGETIRSRNERYFYVFNTCGYYLSEKILANIDEKLITKYSIRKNLLYRFKGYVDYYLNSTNDKINVKSSDVLCQTFIISIKKLLIDMSYDATFIFENMYVDNSKKNFLKKMKEINLIIKNLKFNTREMISNAEFKDDIQNIIYTYSEAFSDKLAIMLTGIDLKKYLKFICQGYGVKNANEIEDDCVILRILSNMYSGKWETNDIRLDGKIKEYSQIYKKFLYYSERDYYSSLPSLFVNPRMLKCLIDYLDICSEKFNQLFSDKNDTFFKDLKNMINGELNLRHIQSYTIEYRKYIIEHLSKSVLDFSCDDS